MRSFAFNVAYWFLSIVYGLTAAFAALAPGRGATSWIIRRYVKRMVQAMRLLAGITIEVRGRDRLPDRRLHHRLQAPELGRRLRHL